MTFHWVYAILILVVFVHCLFASAGAVSSNVHIVYMGGRPHDEPELVKHMHHELLIGILGSKEAATGSMLYSYKHGFSGFAAVLTLHQAKRIADYPGVVRVIPNRIYDLHTTRSWDFLQVNKQFTDGILLKGQAGCNSIIGVFDSGNGKLVTVDGADFLSARDAEGHGTHTSSITACAMVENANFLGLARGLARGGAPSAQLAVYKVCWASGGCSSADILAAFDDAIKDGVDVISMSLGSLPPLATYVDDVVSIGSFHAAARGISVVCSGGNSGPFPQTVVNTAPWVITVAASTVDRAFPVSITLGNNQTFTGQTLYMSKDLDKFYPIVYGADIMATDADENDARSCNYESLNATLAQGKVVLCFETQSQRFALVAARSVKEVEGVGVVFAKFPTKEVSLCLDVPCAQVDLTLGTSLLAYMASSSNPVIKFNVPKTTVGQLVSPYIALFSSRGPSSLSPHVLKPDIAAPGVNILASWSGAPSAKPSGASENEFPSFKFKFASGTSMACPHISAIVALLQDIHPKWSPAAIKSALITSASTRDEYGQAAVAEGAPLKLADPFYYGGGFVDTNRAIDPGLVYDMSTKDHARFLCSMGYNDTAIRLLTRTDAACPKTNNFIADFNLPSITIPELGRSATVSRTVTNVGPDYSIYAATIEAPPGTDVSVEPPILAFAYGVKKLKFKVRFWSKVKAQGTYSFGNLIWEDGIHTVKILLIVRSVIN